MAFALSLAHLLGPGGQAILAAQRAGLAFLDSRSTEELLLLVGQRVPDIPAFTPIDKRTFQDSYRGSQTGPSDDLLVGRGLFYITEQGRLCLDCTAGHYQMTWGYSPPALVAAAQEAVEAGIVWDNHSNIPQTPVKRLAQRLLELANPPGERDPIDTVLLGVCTGSVACSSALKMQLVCYERDRASLGAPVFVVLDGNYHGTDMIVQSLRGMWPQYVHNIETVAVQPNDGGELDSVFQRYGSRVAAFWAEPIMMNREVIPLRASYLQLARRWCDEVGAAMCIDEIQTGFWQPEVFAYRSMGFTPDMVIAGKGMTAGFHPQSAVLYRGRYDVLEQYDAISTNGNAALACTVALACIEMIHNAAPRIVGVGDRIMSGMNGLASEFSDILADARGKRHMAGLKFRRVEDALSFHRRAVAAGLWVRAHAYHAGHSTVLTKLALPADERIVDFVIHRFRELLRGNP